MANIYNIPYTNFQPGDDIEPTQFNSDFTYIEDGLNELYNMVITKGSVTSATVAPTSAPTSVGDVYINTVLKVGYLAVGISSVSDWKVITNG